MNQPHTPRLPNVLVVENSPAIRRLLEVVLRNAAGQVFLAANPEQARSILNEQPVDVAIVEPQGATMLSWTLVEELIAIAIPTIVVTSRATEDVLNEAARLKASAILTKPFSPTNLLETLDRLPDHRSQINVDISGTKTNSGPESRFE